MNTIELNLKTNGKITKRRTRLGVIRDILDVVKKRNGKIKPTHILYKSNLSYRMMDAYLKELIEKSFLVEQKYDKGKTYAVTPKAISFLEGYSQIGEINNSFGLN